MKTKKILSLLTAATLSISAFAGLATTASAEDKALTTSLDYTATFKVMSRDASPTTFSANNEIEFANALEKNDWTSSALIKFTTPDENVDFSKVESATLTFQAQNQNTSRTSTLSLYSTEKSDYDTSALDINSLYILPQTFGTSKGAEVKLNSSTALGLANKICDFPEMAKGDGKNYVEEKADVTSYIKGLTTGTQVFSFIVSNSNRGVNIYGKGAAETLQPKLEITLTDAAPVKYTVKYEDSEGNEIKTADERDGLVGVDYTITDVDKTAITYNDKKYVYIGGGTEKITATETAENNVLVVKFKEAATTTVTLNANYGGNTVKIADTSLIEGDSVTIPYNEYIIADSVLYKTEHSSSNPYFGKTFTGTTENQTVSIDYTAQSEKPIAFIEAEDLGTKVTGNNANIRCSGCAGGYFTSSTKVCTLQPGAYKVKMQAWGNTGETLTVTAGDNKVELATTGSLASKVSDEFVLTEATDVMVSGGNSSKILDYILITGEEYDSANAVWFETFDGESSAADTDEYKNETMATAYTAEFTTTKGYTNPKVSWVINYDTTAEEVGKTTKSQVFSKALTSGQKVSYGLVITGKKLTAKEATITAVLTENSAE